MLFKIAITTALLLTCGGLIVFSVTALAASDTDPPHLVALDFIPKRIDTALTDQIITFTVRLTDDLSGVTDNSVPTQAAFTSPSGKQIAFVVFDPANLVSGNTLDGIYTSEMTLPQFSETGPWQLHLFWLIDEVSNTKTLDLTDVNNLGFPVTFWNGDVYETYLPLIAQ